MPGLNPAVAQRTEVPRVFQVLIAIYVLSTGQIPSALQALFFGLSGGGEFAFTAAFVTAIAVDLLRLAPLFVLARHPLGILHPVILAVLVWPLIVNMASTLEDLGGLGGLFLGQPVDAPHFDGLGWFAPTDIWWGTAYYNLLQFIALLSIFGGFALLKGRDKPKRRFRAFNSVDLRRLLVILIIGVFAGIAAFIYYRGGVDAHLADLARGRFRSLAGLGPLLALFDISTVALVLWMAARPQDAKNPLFIFFIVGVAITQFLSNGSRSATLAVFTTVALAWALRTRRIPWRLAVIMIPIIFLGFGLMNIARTSGFTNESAIEAVASASTSQVLERVQVEIAARRALTSSVPVVTDGWRATGGPLLGRSYAAAVFAMVPRYIWENKPRGPGSIYAQTFLGEVREGMAIPVTPTAEAYWNFGIVGVILLQMLYGMLLGTVHRLYLSNDDNPFIVSFFLLFATTFQMATDNIVLFQQQLLMFGAIYLLARLTTRPGETQAPVASAAPRAAMAPVGRPA